MTKGVLADDLTAAGIDIGGSAVKAGLATTGGAVLATDALPLDPAQAFAAFAQDLGDLIERLAARTGRRVDAIGISTPGVPDRVAGGLAEGGANVPPMRGGALDRALAARFGVPVALENDGLCAANAEARFGRWAGLERYAVVTVGTGVGGALVLGGRPLAGRSGLAPEFGAMCLDPSSPDLSSPGPSGPVPGRLDRLGSASAMVARHAALQGTAAPGGAREVIARAAAGEAAAAQAVEETARWLAQAFGILCNVANLDAVVVGGGVAASGWFLDRVRHHLPFFVWPSALRTPTVEPAVHGNDAGLLGAAAFALEPLGAPPQPDSTGQPVIARTSSSV